MNPNIVQQAKTDIQKGSKSFSLASFFFSKQEKEAAWKLYAWCRYCDDVIDHAPNLIEASLRVQKLIEKTLACYDSETPSEHPWPAFSQVIHTYKIPRNYPLDLLRGFQADAEGSKIETRADLFDYCYCVAGTVGLMMCHVMGINSQVALSHAVDLGRAMQLTNIARDIKEDYLIGRVYIPKAWLNEADLTLQNFLNTDQRVKFHGVVKKLIVEAKTLYDNGFTGLKYLSIRSAWAVCIASYVYRDIGNQILQKDSWDNRVIVSKPRKVYLLAKASFRVFPLMALRLLQPWKSAGHLELWSEK